MMDISSLGKRKGNSAKGHVKGTWRSTAIQMYMESVSDDISEVARHVSALGQMYEVRQTCVIQWCGTIRKNSHVKLASY